MIVDRVGEVRKNNFGSEMEIIKYNNACDIDVYFIEYNWIGKHISYSNFKKGAVECPYERKTYNIGYLGEGKYKSKIEGKLTDYYDKWVGMLRRCYCDKLHKKYPQYKECKVCDEWLNFQNFAKWYEDNYYEVEGQRMELDKDILIKGNKVYSPETCVFVPRLINTVITNRKRDRGKYPVGVTLSSNKKKYISRCSNGKGEFIYIGRYDTALEAFNVHKEYKENIIKSIANKYKEVIPNNLYEAMYRYEVEITD